MNNNLHDFTSPFARKRIVKDSYPLDERRQNYQDETETRWNAVNIDFKGKMPIIQFEAGPQQATVGDVNLADASGNRPLSNWDSKLRHIGDENVPGYTDGGVKNYYYDWLDLSPAPAERSKDSKLRRSSYESNEGRNMRSL